MADKKDMKWNVDLKRIEAPDYLKKIGDYDGAVAQMKQRTHNYELYGMIAKNKSIHDGVKTSGKMFSEGSTQYIMRKSLANTIQRVPDGELSTQYDKASKEHILTQYIFENKVMYSEFEGIDMLSLLTNTFKGGFMYGFCPVRTGFEKDHDDDARISYSIENWADIFVNRDCKDIRRPQTVWHRSYMSKADVEALLTEQGTCRDSTYEEDTVKYVLDHDLFTGKQAESEKLGDRLKGASSLSSLELLTKYNRGDNEFITYVPKIKAVFRTVRNEDPRKGIPWNFFVLEPDLDFPLGLSQVEFLLADQQFQDLFQTSAFKNLLLAMEPPIMVAGWETNPASYRFEPRKIWNLGNNPNQAKVEPVKIENAVLSSFLVTREGIASGMLRQLNVADGTIAKDSGVPGFSATPQGVEAQTMAKEISINQYQKRVEFFFSEWCNQALRMYLNSMGGKHKLTVDEATRRRLFDIGEMDCIDGDKVEIDFDALSTDVLEFKIRTGSLVQKKEDAERKALQETVQPITQNLSGWSEGNRAVVENEILIPALKRLLELSNTDIGNTLSDSLGTHMAKMAMQEIQGQLDSQQQQLDAQGAAIGEVAGALPAMPANAQPDAMIAEGTGMGGTSPSSPPMPSPPLAGEEGIPAGQEVIRPADMLSM